MAFRTLMMLLILCAVPMTLPVTPAFTRDVSLEQCAERVRNNPEDLESYRCYLIVARKGEWEGAAGALEALLAFDSDDDRARLYLAAIKADRSDRQAEEMFRQAADGMAARGDREGETMARTALYHYLSNRGRMDDAETELHGATQSAEMAGDPLLIARVRISIASLAIRRVDFGKALNILKQAESAFFPDGPSDQQSRLLSLMGHAFWSLGRYEEAMEVYRREVDVLVKAGDRYMTASPLYNIALLAGRLAFQGAMDRDESLQHVERAVLRAVEVGHLPLEARSRLLMGQELRGQESIEQYERVREIALQTGDRHIARGALRALAQRVWKEQPLNRSQALAWIDESVEDARSLGDMEEVARGLAVRALMLHETGEREIWIEASERSLQAIERIRDLQPDGGIRARVFSRWAVHYYRFSGRLLEGLGASPDPDGDLELAFRTMERMRARVLLDEMDSAGADSGPGGEIPEQTQRTELLQRIAQVQRRLADTELAGGERTGALSELELLEVEEVALRDAIARANPGFRDLRSPAIPAPAELAGLLSPDQAILSFQLAPAEISRRYPDREGGSWLVLITADGAEIVNLPEKDDIEEQVSVFDGLCRRRDGSEVRPAGILYEILLQEALEKAGPGIERLIVIPDGCLHRFPFAALRRGRGGDPVGAHYQVSQVPSASLWARLKNNPESSPFLGSSLALADPDFGVRRKGDTMRAADPWLDGLRLGRLPHARSEAGRLARALGGDSLVLSGEQASEQFLKQADLGGYGILHLAAHAIVDYSHPERSAIILTPGNDKEDGFLQAREIVNLDLRGRVVLISACRSASGTVLEGEGVLGLARAFFQAGARAVVGSLWQLRDDEAEEFMDRFSAGIEAGDSLSQSMTGARHYMNERGFPAASWAGMVLIGDGDLVPIPGGRPAGLSTTVLVIVSALGFLILGAVALRYMRR